MLHNSSFPMFSSTPILQSAWPITLAVCALLFTSCSVPRALHGGRAVTTRKPSGGVEQSLIQGDNPAQVTRQTQDTIKVRTYTLPAGSRIEQPAALSFTP